MRTDPYTILCACRASSAVASEQLGGLGKVRLGHSVTRNPRAILSFILEMVSREGGYSTKIMGKGGIRSPRLRLALQLYQ
jgi:hypothetical protein